MVLIFFLIPRKKDREKCCYDPNRLFNRFMLCLLPRFLSSIDAERCSLFFLSCSVFLILDFLCLFVIYHCESLNHCFLCKIIGFWYIFFIVFSARIHHFFTDSCSEARLLVNYHLIFNKKIHIQSFTFMYKKTDIISFNYLTCSHSMQRDIGVINKLAFITINVPIPSHDDLNRNAREMCNRLIHS